MSDMGKRGSRRPARWALQPLVMLLALFLASCALVESFDEYGLSATKRRGPFAVRGTVTGLETKRVTLLLHSAQTTLAIEVGDGPFAFPALLADLGRWSVTVYDAEMHTCAVAHGNGTIDGADASDVYVSCFSMDATLRDLSLSELTLSPAFHPAITSYTARARASGLFQPAMVTVLATPSSRAASVLVPASVLRQGASSVMLDYGENPIEVTVVAPDGRARMTYTVVVSLGGVDDPLDSPGTASVALSVDTLAVCSAGVSVYEHAGSPYAHGDTTWGNAFAEFPEGSSVALDGDTLVVGGASDGGAHVFTRAGSLWSPAAVLPGSARSVAIAGETIAIAGPSPDLLAPGPTQRVLVYAKSGSTWEQRASFDFSGFGPSDWTALALSGDTLAVGTAYEAFDHVRPPNAVFLFARTGATWAPQGYFDTQTFTADGGFGSSISLSGNTLAVGAPESYGVYVYTRAGSTWSLEAFVKRPDPSTLFNFGTSVALSGDTLAVGSPRDSNDDSSVGGSVYVLTRSSRVWSFVKPQAQLTDNQPFLRAPTPTKGDGFGQSLALSGTRLVVAAKDAVYGY